LAPGFVRLPVGFFGQTPIRVGLFIQERPQREILVAGASSVKKLVDIRICGAPAGREIWLTRSVKVPSTLMPMADHRLCNSDVQLAPA
jgi:hypothetical protein